MRAWPGPNVPKLPGEPVPLRLFDTSAGEIRPSALGPGAGMYVCGITPYDATHLGHAFTYLAFDLVNRQWRDNGFAVKYVQNVTDVDDPLLERATATGVDWTELAADQIELYRDDMTALRILPPDAYVGVVEEMDMVVERIVELDQRGAVYSIDGDLYFSVKSDPNYGKVSGFDTETQLALFAERGGDPDREGKKDPLDCLLWRAARDGEPSWPSPLGAGRPGWHMECVAIALDHLGMGFDVQGGGSDLVFPHHEMGASEAQVLTEKWPYAQHYVHAGMVGYEGEKMSKSRGNLVFVSRLRNEGHDPMAVRMALLNHHYRSDWEWTDQDLVDGQARLDRWRAAVSPPTGPHAEKYLREIRTALANDLDTVEALALFDAWAREQLTSGGSDDGAVGVMSRASDSLFGVAL